MVMKNLCAFASLRDKLIGSGLAALMKGMNHG
jgi:hypothetical protein